MIDWLVNKAKRTPYFDLPGYMNRWWLVPYNSVVWRQSEVLDPQTGVRLTSYNTDGTGLVSWRRQPLVRLMQALGLAVRVHEILRSDEGRDPHDHPWSFLTIILRGGYVEQRFDANGMRTSTKWHGPGSVLYRPAGTWHRLELPEGTTTTTLFITGKYKGSWGFLVDGKKVLSRNYKNGSEM